MFLPDQTRQHAVFERLRQGILTGTLPSGDRLPPTRALATELGVAYETARQWLLAAGIELRPKGRPSTRAAELDIRQITARYKRGESIATLGKDLGVSPTTVRSRLLEAGVSLRPRPGWTS